MTGKLNHHPLAELIRETVAEKLSGSLRLEHERIKTAIYFDRGVLVYATSNLRPLRLAESLRRWRVITEEQFAALPEDGRNDAETARVLFERKVLTKEALQELRTRLAGDVLRPALLWVDGDWKFDPRVRLMEDVRVELELPELLMEAARRLPASLAATRFPDMGERLAPVSEAANRLDLLPMEAFVLSRVDAPLGLRELLAISGLPEAETLHACYTLALGGLIERTQWPRAFTPEEVEKAQAAAAAAAAKSDAAPATHAAPELKKAEPEPKAAEPEVDEKRELEELFERVGRATNHYQIMGVTRSADPDTLKQTYHRLARRFHPDRFHQDTALRQRVEDAFAKIAQAYETLRDKSSRAAYDLRLERESSARPAEPSARQQQAQQQRPSSSAASTPGATTAERAEASFQKGMGALQAGNAAQAISFFAEAARLEPKVARYRAQYGQALATNEQMRHRAEAEIQAAILLEPYDISYRISLAKLYRSLGFNKRAQGELERARALDPRNAEAQALLAELQST